MNHLDEQVGACNCGLKAISDLVGVTPNWQSTWTIRCISESITFELARAKSRGAGPLVGQP